MESEGVGRKWGCLPITRQSLLRAAPLSCVVGLFAARIYWKLAESRSIGKVLLLSAGAGAATQTVATLVLGRVKTPSERPKPGPEPHPAQGPKTTAPQQKAEDPNVTRIKAAASSLDEGIRGYLDGNLKSARDYEEVSQDQLFSAFKESFGEVAAFVLSCQRTRGSSNSLDLSRLDYQPGQLSRFQELIEQDEQKTICWQTTNSVNLSGVTLSESDVRALVTLIDSMDTGASVTLDGAVIPERCDEFSSVIQGALAKRGVVSLKGLKPEYVIAVIDSVSEAKATSLDIGEAPVAPEQMARLGKALGERQGSSFILRLGKRSDEAMKGFCQGYFSQKLDFDWDNTPVPISGSDGSGDELEEFFEKYRFRKRRIRIEGDFNITSAYLQHVIDSAKSTQPSYSGYGSYRTAPGLGEERLFGPESL